MAADIRFLAAVIAAEINARPEQAAAAIGLIDEGATVPFIARYRKEVTGGLDDTQLRNLSERLVYLHELEARRTSIVDSINSQGKMTDELARKLAGAATKAELEDLYLPYKPKRRTRAEIARERGLQPLADAIWADRTADPAKLAEAYVAGEVTDVKMALEGARDIVAEAISENADLLGRLRQHMRNGAVLKAKVVDGKQEAGAKFSDYFDHSERWATVPGHRALAMLRGWNEEFLTLSIEVDQDDPSPVKPAHRIIAATFQIGTKGPADLWLMEAAGWTWRVKLSTSLSLDLMRELRERAEEEAIHRAVSLAKLVDAALFIVHVSTRGGAEIVRREKLAGTKLFAETCPQYLALTRDDLDRPGMEGAKYICSPPLRDHATQEGLWQHIRAGTFESVSSDHAPYRADATGKFMNGADAPYPKIANGMPGIAMRLPYLFSEGVAKGRITLGDFVRLSSTNAARVFGLDRKGAIVPGFDADIAIWNPDEKRTVTLEAQHDNMDYSPFEGMEITGWPELVMNHGRTVVEKGELKAGRGDGRFIARKPVDTGAMPGHRAVEFEVAARYGKEIAP